MTAINFERKEISRVSLGKDIDHGKRHATDKYWILLFIFAIIIWNKAGPRVYYSFECRINSAFSKTANFTYECVRNETGECDMINYINEAPSHYSSKYVSHNWNKKLVIDWISRHLDFLDGNYDHSGFFVISANILFYTCIIIYSISSIRTDKLYGSCLGWCLSLLCIFNFMSRAILLGHYVADNVSESELPIHNFLFWVLPETVLVIILIKMPIENSDENNDDNKAMDWDSCLFFPAIYLYSVLAASAIYHPIRYKFIWDNELTYLVGVPVICYWCLILYYFLVIASSCATSISVGKPGSLYWKNLFVAPYMVVRYHLGTVCYHATVIFPRIHATFVMNEAEFRKIPAIHRFYLVHWKISNLSPTSTGALGLSHSESIRESLRLFISDSSKSKNFQIHSQILRRMLVLLMAINGLMFILFWTHGVTVDPRYSIGTWISYIFGFSFASILLSFADTVADAIRYRDYENAMIKL